MRVVPPLAPLPASLATARALSGDARGAWRRALVFTLVEDLNAGYDRLTRATRRAKDAAPAVEDARAHAARAIRAASLVRQTALAAAWEFVQDELDRPEDAFGAAVLLLGLEAADPAVTAWARALPAPVLRTLRRLGLPA